MGANSPEIRARRLDMYAGLSILAVAFVGCMLLSVWGMRASTPKAVPPPAPASKVGIEGFPKKVRPFELFERAKTLSVRENFRGLVADGVRSDGTMNFSEKGTLLRFSFQSKSGQGPQPVRKSGTLPQRSYCGIQSVFVGKDGAYAEKDKPKNSCPRPPPQALVLSADCTPEKLWKLAKSRKISQKGSAKIEFFESEQEPAFRFSKGKKSFVVSAKNCKTILKGRASRGRVP